MPPRGVPITEPGHPQPGRAPPTSPMSIPSRTTRDERCLHLRQIMPSTRQNSSLDKPLHISTGVWKFVRGQGLAGGRWACQALGSEERRVGKECRTRWSPYHQKKKKEAEVGCRTMTQVQETKNKRFEKKKRY